MNEPPISESRLLLIRRLTQHRRARLLDAKNTFLKGIEIPPGIQNLDGWLSALDNAIIEVAKAPTLDEAKKVADCFCVQSEAVLK